MKKVARFAFVLALVAPIAAFSSVASAQQDPAFGTVPGEPLAPPPEAAPAAPVAQGQWVETDTYGWVWVPANAQAYEVNNQPYTYLYSPGYGWTWYVSPWGHGRYYAGPWVHARWGAPHVWVGGRGWEAPNGRVVVRGGGWGRAPAPVYHGGGSFHGGGASHGGAHGGGGHHR